MVDKRSDVWAFGCVLYEMLTGRRAFEGEDVTETIVAVVRGQPDWTVLPAEVPEQIRLLLNRCLEKDRRTRVSDIGVARFVMAERLTATTPLDASSAGAGVLTPSSRPRSRRRVAVVAGVGGLALAGLLASAVWMGTRLVPQRVEQPAYFSLVMPNRPLLGVSGFTRDIAISPNGQYLVYRTGSTAVMVCERRRLRGYRTHRLRGRRHTARRALRPRASRSSGRSRHSRRLGCNGSDRAGRLRAVAAWHARVRARQRCGPHTSGEDASVGRPAGEGSAAQCASPVLRGGAASPDGTRVALDVRDKSNDIWIWNIRGHQLTPLNVTPAQDLSPVWTPDGHRVIWTSNRGGGNPNLYWQSADGTGAAERLTTNYQTQFPTSISPDGTRVALFGLNYEGTGEVSISVLHMNDASGRRPVEPLLSGGLRDLIENGEISPDGRWIAYQSNESGQFQVYVRPFPKVDEGRSPVSPAGGTRPMWARDGRELFYLDGNDHLTSVPVQTRGATFIAGAPTQILKTRYYAGWSTRGYHLRAFDISPDGNRFLMIKDIEPVVQTSAAAPPSVTVVLNWFEELKARVPVK